MSSNVSADLPLMDITRSPGCSPGSVTPRAAALVAIACPAGIALFTSPITAASKR
jgi:hypothetical protein